MKGFELKLVIAVSGITWLALLVINGAVAPSVDLTKPFGTVVAIVSLGVLAFDRWAWRWRIFRGWLVKAPDISGRYRGTLNSTWLGDAGEPLPPIDATLEVRQTYTSTRFALETRESSSDTLCCNLIVGAKVVELIGSYSNEPRFAFRNRSPIHFGTARLRWSLADARLQGHYWTDRDTQGEMDFLRMP